MKRIKNNYTIFFFLILLFGIFVFLIYKPHNYVKKYNINNYTVVEEFHKNNNYYTFLISKDDITYSYLIKNKYTNHRRLINDIKEDNNCILPLSNDIILYPLCYSNNIVYSYNLNNNSDLYKYKDFSPLNEKYNNITINYLNGKKFLLYNYKGYYLLNDKKDINLFDKDYYNIDLVYYYDNYLIVPNYNEDYYFSKFFIINLDNGKKEEIKLDKKISFDSIFLGNYKNNIYLLDKKEEKEYKINVKKRLVEETEFYILENNKLVKKNYYNIINNQLLFDKNIIYNFTIIDNTLYQIINENRIKISNLDVSKIIKIENDTVYYLSKDSLYMFNNIYGEVLLLKNFEWNFNYTNMIFISE